VSARASRIADWLGLNRAAAAVLVVIGGLGLAEEIWANFVSLYIRDHSRAARAGDPAGAVVEAALVMGVVAAAKNLLEGAGYLAGGTIAHRLGPRWAFSISTAPMLVGFAVMASSPSPWTIAIGAVLLSNWEPLSVPATFDVVGATVRKERRTIAFALQSIQKRVPKLLGPAAGGLAFALVGFWLNLGLAFALVALATVLQLSLLGRLQPRPEAPRTPWRSVLARMPRDLRHLLHAEILIRWGDWFARDFAVLYVVTRLVHEWGWADAPAAAAAGGLLSLMALTALATYVPMAKWIDRASSPRPFIAATFLLFSLFPIALVTLPRAFGSLGLPATAGFAVAFVLNGLREIGEPARKALITTGFDPDIRARGVGLYWGLRSFAFFPAPIVAALLWRLVGPDLTFLIGGAIGLAGTAWFLWRRPV
jgi:MFS family permease